MKINQHELKIKTDRGWLVIPAYRASIEIRIKEPLLSDPWVDSGGRLRPGFLIDQEELVITIESRGGYEIIPDSK
jgi:hypothetical protein